MRRGIASGDQARFSRRPPCLRFGAVIIGTGVHLMASVEVATAHLRP